MTFPLADAQSASEWRDSGQVVDKITRAIMIEAESQLGYPITLVQGGNKPKTSYSGTTHVRLGVGDIAAYDWERKCEVFMGLGCYIYHRPYVQGLWGEHCHFGVIDHPWRDPMLAQQQDDWLHHPPLDGLKGTSVYTDGPHTNGRKIVFDYDPTTELQVAPMTELEQAKEDIVLAIHHTGEAAAHLGDAEEARGQIKRLKDVHKDLRGILKVVQSKTDPEK